MVFTLLAAFFAHADLVQLKHDLAPIAHEARVLCDIHLGVLPPVARVNGRSHGFAEAEMVPQVHFWYHRDVLEAIARVNDADEGPLVRRALMALIRNHLHLRRVIKNESFNLTPTLKFGRLNEMLDDVNAQADALVRVLLDHAAGLDPRFAADHVADLTDLRDTLATYPFFADAPLTPTQDALFTNPTESSVAVGHFAPPTLALYLAAYDGYAGPGRPVTRTLWRLALNPTETLNRRFIATFLLVHWLGDKPVLRPVVETVYERLARDRGHLIRAAVLKKIAPVTLGPSGP